MLQLALITVGEQLSGEQQEEITVCIVSEVCGVKTSPKRTGGIPLISTFLSAKGDAGAIGNGLQRHPLFLIAILYGVADMGVTPQGSTNIECTFPGIGIP